MSYTLKGRLESRVTAALLPLLAACILASALPAWWPVELAALMIGAGLALDLLYDRLLEYQPGWLALPLGALELAVIMGLVRLFGIGAPLGAALGFYAASWLVGQLFAHAGFPLLYLSYAEDGGELGRSGPGAAAITLVVLAAAGGVAWAKLPPTVHLSAGVHQGPLVITRRENLVGERGAVVRGGIKIRASHVTVRNVTVVGGENGIDVEEAHDVLLENVRIVGARMDGIHVRRGRVTIRDCTIDSPPGYTQGIDISFSADKGMSMIEGCTVVGGQEGILIDSSGALVRRNRVSSTTQHAISVNEMSMGMVEHNEVVSALGVAIYCGDHSMCEIDRNVVSDTRADPASGDRMQLGYGILSHYGSEAELRGNVLVRTPKGVGTFAQGTVRPLGG